MNYTISNLLQEGRARAKTTAQLMAETGLSERRLRKAVHDERLQGKLIVSVPNGTGGYYLAENRAELEPFLHAQEKRAKSSFASVKETRKALKSIDGQFCLDDMEVELDE